MVFNYIKQNKKVERGKIYVYSSIQFILTLFVLASSFTVIDIPILLIIPYVVIFSFFLIMTIKYSDKILKFSIDNKGNMIANFDIRARIGYIISVISRLVISIIAIMMRIDILQKLGISHSPLLVLQEPSITIIILLTIIFDILLLASKGIMAGMHTQMLRENKKVFDK